MAKNSTNRKLFMMPGPNPYDQVILKGMPSQHRKFVGKMPVNGAFPKNAAALDNYIEKVRPGYKQELLLAGATMAAGAVNNIIPGKLRSAGAKLGGQVKGNARVKQPGSIPVVFSGERVISEANTSYALSPAPNPKNISLNSGVKPNCYVNDYMSPLTGVCSPLHMTGITLQLPTTAANPLTGYIANTICFDIQTRAQANVDFALDIVGAFSAVSIVSAMNASIYALQVYFYYSSILSYESNPRNKNAGMIALRATITPDILSDLNQLGRRLEDTPIPPRIVEWVRYMSGNFLSNNNQGSPLLKTYVNSNQLVGSAPSPTLPAQALANLVTNNATYVLLRRSVPHWTTGTLYDCPTVPTFDKNFLSIFANLPGQNFSGATTYNTNAVANNSAALRYNTYTNVLDGLAYAMGSMVTPGAVYFPGIVQPVTANATYTDNRLSYYTSGFAPVNANTFLALSRQETTQFIANTIYTPHLAGTESCQSVTGLSLGQTAQNVMDFLFDVKSVSVVGKLSSFSRSA